MADGMTRLDRDGSRATTVPTGIDWLAGTHSATSWYLAAMLPVTVKFPPMVASLETVAAPITWSFVEGALVPIPTLPDGSMRIRSVIPLVANFIGPFKVKMLMA